MRNPASQSKPDTSPLPSAMARVVNVLFKDGVLRVRASHGKLPNRLCLKVAALPAHSGDPPYLEDMNRSMSNTL